MPKVVHPLNSLMRSQNFCSTLFVARREAEHEGILDFTVNLQVQPTEASTKEAPEADLTATIDRGTPFHIGRIEFTGNRHFSEAAVRSNFLLDEGDLLDEHLLRKSMARLNEANYFEPVSERTTILHTDPKTGIADIDIRVMERKRGSWNLSGPVGPASVAGPLEASIRTRLPAWGSGLLEASTYTVSLSMFAFVHSFLPVGLSEDSLDSSRRLEPALYAGRRLEIGIHDHSSAWAGNTWCWVTESRSLSIACFRYCKATAAWSRNCPSPWTLPAAEPQCSAIPRRRVSLQCAPLWRWACVSSGSMAGL